MPKTRELTLCCCAGRGVVEEVKRDTCMSIKFSCLKQENLQSVVAQVEVSWRK